MPLKRKRSKPIDPKELDAFFENLAKFVELHPNWRNHLRSKLDTDLQRILNAVVEHDETKKKD